MGASKLEAIFPLYRKVEGLQRASLSVGISLFIHELVLQLGQ